MSDPCVVVQLTDPHIGATWAGPDPGAGLAAAVQVVNELRPAPAAVLVTGDLANTPSDAEYERVRELLAPLSAPVHVLPGNHDDRALMRRHFELPGTADEPVQSALDDQPLRIVVLDSTLPGDPDGAGGLGAERLAWLDETLAGAPGKPTLIATHHPPLVTGLPAMDAIGLAQADRAALADLLERHPQVRAIAAGHVHRAIAGQLAGRPVLAAPSTYAQLHLDLELQELRFSDFRPGFALHALIGDELVSHAELLEAPGR